MAPLDPQRPTTQIDHAELKWAAKQFADEDTRLTGEVRVLLNKIISFGHIYGDDDTGRQADQGFSQAQDNINKYIGSLCGAYDKTGAALAVMESNIGVANWNIMATLPNIDTKSIPRFGS